MITGYTVLSASVHQHLCSENIGLQKYFRILYAAVNVGLRSEVHNDVGVLLLKESINSFPIANVG